MISKIRALLFEAKILQKETIFFISEGIFLALFTYLIFSNANSLSEMGNYFHNINIALFTILIPLAIAVLSDYFRDKRNGNSKVNYSELDLIVIINSVFDVRLILITVLLSYFPSFFWTGSNFFVKDLLLIIWLIGVGILVKIILDFIIWIKDPFHHRFKFLRKIKENDEYISAWSSVWKAKENNRNNEVEFFEIFSKNINYLIRKNKTDQFFISLMSTFSNQLQNREKDILIYWNYDESPFSKILEWYYKSENPSDRDILPFDYLLRPVLEQMEVYSFNGNYARYLELVKIHIEKHLDNAEYIENFFSIFLSILFENIDKISSEMMFWRAYPEEWKVKSLNLENKKLIPFITLKEIILWSERRVSDEFLDNKLGTSNSTYDSKLNKVFYNLFPDTEPISWANIFTFLFFPYSHNKMEEIIKSRRAFGMFGRVTIAWGENSSASEKMEMQHILGVEENTKLLRFIYRIIPTVFPNYGTIKDYQGILFALESEYKDDRHKLIRVKEFQDVLRVIEDFIKELEKNNEAKTRKNIHSRFSLDQL